MHFSDGSPSRKHVLDVGCGCGHTSLQILRLFEQLGIRVDYTALDPYREQLDLFRARADAQGRMNLKLIQSSLQGFHPANAFDLVIASHSLYYMEDISSSIEKILALGIESIVIHHGPRGINEVHDRFPPWVNRDGFIISTYNDVSPHLPKAEFLSFQGSVDVACCQDPSSTDGLNLLTFFFERDFLELPASVRAEAHAFFRETFPETMVHDVGVFVTKQPKMER